MEKLSEIDHLIAVHELDRDYCEALEACSDLLRKGESRSKIQQRLNRICRSVNGSDRASEIARNLQSFARGLPLIACEVTEGKITLTAAPTTAPRRRRAWRWVVIAAIIMVAAAFVIHYEQTKPVYAQSVEVHGSSGTISYGEYVTVTADILPQDSDYAEIVWECSDDGLDITVLDDGSLSVHMPMDSDIEGRVTITATNPASGKSGEWTLEIDRSWEIVLEGTEGTLTIPSNMDRVVVSCKGDVFEGSIVVASRNDDLTLVLDRISLTSDGACLSADRMGNGTLTLMTVGAVDIRSVSGTSPAIVAGDLTVEIDGQLTVTGSDGSAGGDGNPAMEAYRVVIGGSGKATFTGGDGGDGSHGCNGTIGTAGKAGNEGSPGGDGGRGGDGGNGSDGGDGAPAIISDSLTVSYGLTVTCYGGDGGDGGNGGSGGSGGSGGRGHNTIYSSPLDAGDGGNGGDGGDGGNGGDGAKGIVTTSLTGSPLIHTGNGGQGGNAGAGGRGGSGGNGHVNGWLVFATPVVSSGGDGGDGGDGGSPGAGGSGAVPGDPGSGAPGGSGGSGGARGAVTADVTGVMYYGNYGTRGQDGLPSSQTLS